jgi:nicotinamidase-related amidase
MSVSRSIATWTLFGAGLAITAGITAPELAAQTIIEEWATLKAPAPPALAPVTIGSPKETALLMVDFVKQICSPERIPRCVASIPKVQGLLKEARAKGVHVIYSTAFGSSVGDIWPEVAPLPGDPVVQSVADKFFRTDLEKILSDRGVKTLIVVGTAAQGGVMHTASQAAWRGLKVIVPVDGMSAENPYVEQYVVQQFVGPIASAILRGAVTVTKLSLIGY